MAKFLANFSARANVSRIDRLTMIKPDDWHLHVRDGDVLRSVVPFSAKVYRRAIIMPNLKPPIVCTKKATEYKRSILSATPKDATFTPLMTLYLTDDVLPADVHVAANSGITAYKMYPAGATTNSQAGVTNVHKLLATFEAMAEVGMPLLLHGEVTDLKVDFFDREKYFLDKVLDPIRRKVPNLKIVLEHVTTKDAIEYITSNSFIAGTITPQHLLWNRNKLFDGGLNPHAYCLPVLKREEHRLAVFEAAVSGNPKFFLGTDSAPHPKNAKESSCGCAGIFSSPVALSLYASAFDVVDRLDLLEGFTSRHGPDFYGLPYNTEQITLLRKSWTVPEYYLMGNDKVVPMMAGQEVDWTIE